MSTVSREVAANAAGRVTGAGRPIVRPSAELVAPKWRSLPTARWRTIYTASGVTRKARRWREGGFSVVAAFDIVDVVRVLGVWDVAPGDVRATRSHPVPSRLPVADRLLPSA